jgi:hypothetical protein
VKSYYLKISGREEGPYFEAQIAQMFADQQVNRSTPCKPQTGGDWKTIDDCLPMLKYGTQLPVPTKAAMSVAPPPLPANSSVRITDIDVPFGSVLKMAFKIFAAWLIVACCFAAVFIGLWFFLFAAIFAFFGHAFSAAPHP